MATRYMTTEEVADLCRTSAESVRYWRNVGKGPDCIKVGRRVLYAVDDVESWLASQPQAVRATA